MATPLDAADRDLLATAEATLREQYAEGRHHTAAALRTVDGRVETGVSLKARTGVADVHAEPVALARACLTGAGAPATPSVVVAVKPRDPEAWGDGPREGAPTRIVSACGQCREALLAFGPEMDVVVAGDEGPEKRALASLPSGL
jgi:cytidine deaminase